jgi:hypothetical protein
MPYIAADTRALYEVVTRIGGMPGSAPASGDRRVNLVPHRQVGHSLGAIAFGLLGALVGCRFAARVGRATLATHVAPRNPEPQSY